MKDKYFEDLREQYQELCDCEEEIKNKLKKSIGFEKKFKKYGVLDKKWVDTYKKYLFDSLNNKVRKKFRFKAENFVPEKEEKIFCLITDNKTYYFPVNFTLVSEKFINLLSRNIKDIKYLHILNSRIYNIAFIGKFIIRKHHIGDDNYYITLYNESVSNNVDFILYYCKEDKNEIEENLNLIFNNDFWHYIEINRFSYEELVNIILNNKKEKIGYFLRNCDTERCQYIFQMKNKSNLNNNNLKLSNSVILNNKLNNNMINNMNNKMTLLNLNNNSNNIMNFMNINNSNNFFNGPMNINNNYINNNNHNNNNYNNNNNNNYNNNNNNYNNNNNNNSNNNNNYNYNYISYLENELQKSKKTIEDQKVIINNLQNQLNNEKKNNFNNMNLIQSLQNSIKEKEQELAQLMNQFQNNNQNKSRYGRDELLCVNFISMDQKIQYAIPCTGNDIFAEIEEKLYQKFPQYRETNNFFLSDGKQILRFKTISQNKIGGFPVIMNIP